MPGETSRRGFFSVLAIQEILRTGPGAEMTHDRIHRLTTTQSAAGRKAGAPRTAYVRTVGSVCPSLSFGRPRRPGASPALAGLGWNRGVEITGKDQRGRSRLGACT